MSFGRFIAILLLTLSLSTAAGAATITGSVLSEAEGDALGNITVAVYSTTGTLEASTTTSSRGIYTTTVGAGSYRLVAWDVSGEFATSFYDEAPNFEASEIVTVAGSASVFADFRLVRNGWITGTVNAAGTHRALGSMTVAAYDAQGYRRATVTSDGLGAYTLALPPGNYRIAAWDDTLEYAVQFHPSTFAYETARPVNVTAGSVVKGIDFELPKSASITGIVRDGSTGSPLKNMVVEAWAGGQRVQQTTTDASGRYTLRVPPTSVKLLSWDPAGVYATVFDGDAASFDRTLPRSPAAGSSLANVDLSMVRGGRINGVVASASSGTPLREMTVTAFNLDGSVRSSTRTDAGGSYSLLLPPGDYAIAAWDAELQYLPLFYSSAREFEDATPLAVSSDVIASGIDLLLVQGGRVKGLVTSGSPSTPLKGIEVFLYDLQGRQIATATTEEGGRFVVAAGAGAYRLVAADPQRVFATWYYPGAKNFETSAILTIVAGKDLEIAAVLAVGARVDGKVRNLLTGAAIEGVRVAAFDLEGAEISTIRTDSNGLFSLLVPPGSYRIAAGDTSHRYATSWYDGSSTFTEAKTILLGSGIVRPMDFVLEPQDPSRRRGIRRR